MHQGREAGCFSVRWCCCIPRNPSNSGFRSKCVDLPSTNPDRIQTAVLQSEHRTSIRKVPAKLIILPRSKLSKPRCPMCDVLSHCVQRMVTLWIDDLQNTPPSLLRSCKLKAVNSFVKSLFLLSSTFPSLTFPVLENTKANAPPFWTSTNHPHLEEELF